MEKFDPFPSVEVRSEEIIVIKTDSAPSAGLMEKLRARPGILRVRQVEPAKYGKGSAGAAQTSRSKSASAPALWRLGDGGDRE